MSILVYTKQRIRDSITMIKGTDIILQTNKTPNYVKATGNDKDNIIIVTKNNIIEVYKDKKQIGLIDLNKIDSTNSKQPTIQLE